MIIRLPIKLFNTDYPTDTTRFNALLEEREQKRVLNEQQIIRDEQEARLDRKFADGGDS
jgi:hypothetical protein